MASRGAVLRGALSIPGGARPTPAPQGSSNGGLLAPSIGQVSPLAAQLANEGGYSRAYGGFLPRPTKAFTEGAFGPFSPILPVPIDEPPPDAERPEARRFDYRVGWNLPVGQPGAEGLKLASFETLQRLADVYSIARACIEYRKNQVRGIEWDIIPTPEAQKDYKGSPAKMADFGKRRAKAVQFFKRPDRDYGSYALWLSALLEEVLVYDALSILIRPVRGKGRGKGLLGSDLDSFMLVHGPTIRPLLDLHGGTPRPPAPAYQQYLHGVPRSDYLTMITQADLDELGMRDSWAAQFKGDQLMYVPMVPRAWTPYGFSPVERALIPIMTGLQKQGFQYDWFSESTVPAAYIIPGDTAMTPNQLRELQDALNAIAGDPAWKQKIIVLPPGSHVEPQKPINAADELDQWLTTEVCMAFGVTPMEIGVTPGRSSSVSGGAQNQMAKMTQDRAEDSGVTPLLKYLADIFNAVLTDVVGQTDMMFTFEGLQQEEDQDALTGVLVQQIQNGLRTIDEGRQELNLQPYGLEESSEPLFVTPTGPVPLSTAVQNAQNASAQQQAQTEQTQAQTQSTQHGVEASQARLQMQQESHNVSMNEGPPQPTASAGAEGVKESKKPIKPVTPGDSAARAANQATTKKQAADPVTQKRATSEYEALARHLSKGRPVSTWDARFIPATALADVARGMAEGLDVRLAVSLAKARAEKSVMLAPSEYEWVTHQAGDRLVTTRELLTKDDDETQWPGWERDQQLAEQYAPKVATAFGEGMSAAKAFLGDLFDGSVRVTATWAAQKVRDLIAAAMRKVLGPLWTEGYALGRQSARAVLGSASMTTPDWGTWEPGDFDAAARVASGAGLKKLLEQWGINAIQSISETRLDGLAEQIAQSLVDGDSSAALAKRIEDMLNVPGRAKMIAQTELARATTAATLDTYHEAGVERKQWLVAPDERVCKICRAAEAEGAIPSSKAFASGKNGPPGHPHCRCALLPASIGDVDLTDMTSEPFTGFNAVPAAPALVKEGGKEGYIHGWICVRPPCGEAGASVSHPAHGNGTITGLEDGKLHAKFDSGHEAILGDEDRQKGSILPYKVNPLVGTTAEEKKAAALHDDMSGVSNEVASTWDDDTALKDHVADRLAATMKTPTDELVTIHPGVSQVWADVKAGKVTQLAITNYGHVVTNEEARRLNHPVDWVSRSPAGFERMVRKAAISHLIGNWATSSNDDDAEAVALQVAAAREFKLEASKVASAPELQDDSPRVAAVLASKESIYRDFLRSQYELTQEDLRKAGIKEIALHRGMSFDHMPEWVPDEGAMKKHGTMVKAPSARPLSSWSTSADVADSFAGDAEFTDKGYGISLSAVVPAARVLSYPKSGMGCHEEDEVVVLGGYEGIANISSLHWPSNMIDPDEEP
jgi:SPP1 gp7 family putative phage head morphogenesis protein